MMPKSIEPPCPMFFIYRQCKPMMFHSEQWARELAARRGCAVLALPDGHWVMADAPQAFNDALSVWLMR